MQDILHALGFVLVAGAVFMALIVAERAFWIRRHRPNARRRVRRRSAP